MQTGNQYPQAEVGVGASSGAETFWRSEPEQKQIVSVRNTAFYFIWTQNFHPLDPNLALIINI